MNATSASPVFLFPALPSDLIHYIIHHCTYPTTLIICSSRAEFLSTLTQDVLLSSSSPSSPSSPSYHVAKNQTDEKTGQDQNQKQQQQSNHPPHLDSPLLQPPPLYQLAVTRHIRTVFLPTVSHLCAFLSVFSTTATTRHSKISVPPVTVTSSSSSPPLLLVYGFLALHRDTSEWSVQGLSTTSAVLVEAAKRTGLKAVVVEPRLLQTLAKEEDEETEEGERMLAEKVPILSGSVRRATAGLGTTGWTGRTVDVRTVLRRWFRFRKGDWESRETRREVVEGM